MFIFPDIPTYFAQVDAKRQNDLQNASADIMERQAVKSGFVQDIGNFWERCTPPSILAEIIKW